MGGKLPAITGKQPIRLFRLDAWIETGRRTHGIDFAKSFPDGTTKVTLVPDRNEPLPDGTLGAILGHKKSCIGRKGWNA